MCVCGERWREEKKKEEEEEEEGEGEGKEEKKENPRTHNFHPLYMWRLGASFIHLVLLLSVTLHFQELSPSLLFIWFGFSFKGGNSWSFKKYWVASPISKEIYPVVLPCLQLFPARSPQQRGEGGQKEDPLQKTTGTHTCAHVHLPILWWRSPRTRQAEQQVDRRLHNQEVSSAAVCLRAVSYRCVLLGSLYIEDHTR